MALVEEALHSRMNMRPIVRTESFRVASTSYPFDVEAQDSFVSLSVQCLVTVLTTNWGRSTFMTLESGSASRTL